MQTNGESGSLPPRVWDIGWGKGGESQLGHGMRARMGESLPPRQVTRLALGAKRGSLPATPSLVQCYSVRC